ncbi:DUF4142 domain-containing protein [Ramlibacter sp. AW1]|uniref:DUF4142 domain-containing protein n=1 Tax=Ramlibacter aurantiacus TaxID=2801330 RepID=A0A936ZHV9_9BURK|nr:DUF4142 domain-containing protein [Ramlibacter aurantiacus]MBL0420523.1 DUF4142 domain-containing protein [Ramlibacter aurantiacus]
MTHRFLIAPVAVAAALCFGTVAAQTGTAASTSGSSTASGTAAGAGTATPRPSTPARDAQAGKSEKKDLARGDRKFIEEAAGHGMFEVQAGQLAAQKASNPSVKSFGETLVKDHTAANQELQQIASKLQVEVKPELPRSMRNKLENLQKKNGAEFDQEFIKEVGLKAHEDDVKKFKSASKDLKDPQLKAFAEKTLPTLEKHLAEAKQLDQTMSARGKSDSRTSASGAGPAPASKAGSTGTTGGGMGTGSTGPGKGS